MSIRKIEKFTKGFFTDPTDMAVIEYAMSKLFHAGFLDYNKIRNVLIIEDFTKMLRNNDSTRTQIYNRLGVLYNLRPSMIRLIICQRD